MKTSIIALAASVLISAPALSAANPTSRPAKYHEPIKIEKKWRKYNPGKINFSIQSPETEGAKIYSNIVKDPDTYITDNARRVLQTLYFSPKDSIPNITDIDYVVRKFDGISYKSGGGNRVRIDYSTDFEHVLWSIWDHGPEPEIEPESSPQMGGMT